MRVLVTGGGGFLGSAICRALQARGDTPVAFGRSAYPALAARGIETRRGDTASLDAVLDASRGCGAIIHTAAKAGAWGAYDDYYESNVTGTANVLAACHINGIGRLVHTSTPSVVHAGGDLEGVDESQPIATRFHAHYPKTKAIAERRVLEANGEKLATIALRPHLIWGPGDNHLLPRIVARAKAGRLRLIGQPGKRIDVVYIDNAAQAHLDALDHLQAGARCAGRAYFISQGEPIATDAMINGLLGACGLPPETRRIPYPVAWTAGAILEGAYTLLRREDEPPMTRFIANQLATAHWFDIGAARRELGYAPTISIDEGLRRVAAWWRETHRA